MSIRCFFGIHDNRLHTPGLVPVVYAQVGKTYVTRCTRCNKTSGIFVLTREMML